jgi:hypothetical protein
VSDWIKCHADVHRDMIAAARADERAKVMAAAIAQLDADGAYDTIAQFTAFEVAVTARLKTPNEGRST